MTALVRAGTTSPQVMEATALDGVAFISPTATAVKGRALIMTSDVVKVGIYML